MWKIGGLKRGGRASVKRNYWRCVLVSLVVLALAGAYNFTLRDEGGNLSNIDLRGTSNAEIVGEVSRNLFGEESGFWQAFSGVNQDTKGILGTIFNSATQAGSLVFGVLNAVNEFLFGDAVSAGIIIAVGTGIIFLYFLFVKTILRVGQLRFYLETRTYPESRLPRLFFIYRHRRTRHVAFVQLCRVVFTGLWFLTIVGGPVALYAWRMVPYLLAENPDITRKEAFAESRRMMRGQKWHAFLLDLSFLGWYILDSITFGLAGILWVTPYKIATDCELYITLRETALQNDREAARIFNDPCLVPAIPLRQPAEYPVDAFPIPVRESRRWIGAEYTRRYSFTDVILLFFAFCLIGYIYEVVFYLVGTGEFVNRGTMYGPWLPIYGTGGVAIILLLRKLLDKPVAVFFLIMGICGVVEYFGGWFLDTFQNTKWWDYTDYFLNINGYVCLESLLAFGIMGMLGIYFIAPSLAGLFDKIPKPVRYVLCVVLSAVFAVDFVYSQMHPNTASSVLEAPLERPGK